MMLLLQVHLAVNLWTRQRSLGTLWVQKQHLKSGFYFNDKTDGLRMWKFLSWLSAVCRKDIMKTQPQNLSFGWQRYKNGCKIGHWSLYRSAASERLLGWMSTRQEAAVLSRLDTIKLSGLRHVVSSSSTQHFLLWSFGWPQVGLKWPSSISKPARYYSDLCLIATTSSLITG